MWRGGGKGSYSAARKLVSHLTLVLSQLERD